MRWRYKLAGVALVFALSQQQSGGGDSAGSYSFRSMHT